MPLDPDRARRVLHLTAVPPDRLSAYERGELRALIREASGSQRAAIVRALALADVASQADTPYARGVARGADYRTGEHAVRYE